MSKIFANGIIFKRPQNAPDYVIGSLSVKVEEFIGFLKEQGGEWVNLKIMESKGGKPYIELDTWKPKQRTESSYGRSKTGVAPEDIDPATDESLPF